MKIEVPYFTIFLLSPFLISNVNAEDLRTKHAAIIQQGCQMGSEDANSGKSMYSAGISLKNAGGKYVELEDLIREEYEKCYRQSNSPVNGKPGSTPDTNNSSKTEALASEDTAKMRQAGNEKNAGKDYSELKLPPGTSEKPFAWFYDWVSVVEEATERYAAEKENAKELREEFIRSCHSTYLMGKNDKTLIDRWCKIPGWKESELESAVFQDDSLKKQLQQMKQQIIFSEESYSKFGDRDVKNAFDRANGPSFDYQMQNFEQQKIMPFLSAVNSALGNIKATGIAMAGLDEQTVAKRKKEYLSELEKIKQKRADEKVKQIKSKKHAIYLKQKPQADLLLEDACNIAREDAENLRVPLPDQFKSQAEILDLVDGLEGSVAARYRKCYDAELISLTCKQAAEDFMKCLDEGSPSKYAILASDKMTKNALKAEYNKCHLDRKKLYTREKNGREKSSKNYLKYKEIYRQKGGYFINDYNECVDSIKAATNKLSRKMLFSVISNSAVRLCEDEKSLIDGYARRSCSCSYGVVVDSLPENKFTDHASDILALISSSHSSLGNTKAAPPDETRVKNSLRHPEASTALFRKIGQECAM